MITSFARVPAERAQAETKRLGTKWLTFWNVSLPVGGVLGLLMSLTAPLVEIIVIPLSFSLSSPTAFRRKLWAWRWNWILVVVSYLAMSMPTPSVESSGSGGELLGLFFIRLALVWI